MPPKPNLKFRPPQNAPRAGASPPLTSFNEEEFDEDVSLEAMALQLQRESGLTYRGGINYEELDGHGKGSAEALDDIRLYPKRAPQLPANTMPSLLTSETAHGAHGHVYAPIPLNHKDAMQPVGLNRTGIATKAGSATSASTAAVKAEEEDRGVAFLKEGAEEDVRAWQANRQFHEQILKPNVLASSSFSTASVSSPSPVRSNDDDLVWLQMPRFYENPPFDLSTMEPGKVGELVVLKSGRMLLRIHNVYYDVSASCEEEQLSGPSETARPTSTSGKPLLEGPCSMAVISTSTTPTTQFGNNERPSVSCYEVGLLTKKLVCTPTISESS